MASSPWADFSMSYVYSPTSDSAVISMGYMSAWVDFSTKTVKKVDGPSLTMPLSSGDFLAELRNGVGNVYDVTLGSDNAYPALRAINKIIPNTGKVGVTTVSAGLNVVDTEDFNIPSYVRTPRLKISGVASMDDGVYTVDWDSSYNLRFTKTTSEGLLQEPSPSNSFSFPNPSGTLVVAGNVGLFTEYSGSYILNRVLDFNTGNITNTTGTSVYVGSNTHVKAIASVRHNDLVYLIGAGTTNSGATSSHVLDVSTNNITNIASPGGSNIPRFNLVDIPNAYPTQGGAFIYDNQVHLIRQGELYRYNSGTDSWSLITTSPFTVQQPDSPLMQYGTEVAWTYSSGGDLRVDAYDFDTDVWRQFPIADDVNRLYSYHEIVNPPHIGNGIFMVGPNLYFAFEDTTVPF